ncbi:MAG: hypothetical protein QNL94_13000 [Halioglobus sp.]|jgi:hypothetical protein|tara:strand:+ start:560 stop:688 length:129 start_codon:yes stop_codon:yes gene_type:complete
MESIDNDDGALLLSNGELLVPAKYDSMPAHEFAFRGEQMMGL